MFHWITRFCLSRWTLLLCACMGPLLGLGVYTFWYGQGASYFSSNPKSCVNCHIMREQFDGWQHASHHAHATCVECHLPDDFVGKTIAKAEKHRQRGDAPRRTPDARFVASDLQVHSCCR